MADYIIDSDCLKISGSLNKDTVADLFAKLQKEIDFEKIDYISLLDLDNIDSAGVAMLDELIIMSGKELVLNDMNTQVK
ncbi:MAG: hypothetical protein RBS16_10155, partial [Candidatus Cloacimonadales bacterium]|nr:hypothetical protein [Candidatus Cloacimonadales bacterium]